jgi:hypothetical protein
MPMPEQKPYHVYEELILAKLWIKGRILYRLSENGINPFCASSVAMLQTKGWKLKIVWGRIKTLSMQDVHAK